MTNAPTLIVPIDLEALCVGAEDVQNSASSLAPMADFSVLPYVRDGQQIHRSPYLNSEVLAGASPFAGQVPFVQGIHLHWALPDGLTHGLQEGGEGQPVRFPQVPNRWLLTRIILNTADPQQPTVSTRSWIIESDRLSQAATATPGLAQPTVPLSTTPVGQNFRYLGQSFDLADWQEQGTSVERFSPLTAVGYGEAAFAAYYPNSSTVFGFLDTLADVDGFDPNHSVIAYQVSGWYAAPAVDPLSEQDIDPSSNPFGWRFTPGNTPKQTVLSGLIHGIAWDPGARFLGDTAAELKVAVASSSQEALSALMASLLSGPEAQNAEQLLNALQFGLLSKTGEVAGSLQAFEEAVHAAGFASQTGGTLWSLQRKGTDADASEPLAEVTLPEPLAEDLDDLNTLQAELDELRQKLAGQRWQLFADWYKYLVLEYAPSDVPETLRTRAQSVQEHLRDSIEAIHATEAQVAAAGPLQRAIDEQREILQDLMGDEYVLRGDASAPRYWQPHDPVVVMAGEDVVPTRRYGSDGFDNEDGMRPCRLDSELVTSVTLAAGAIPGSEAVRLDSSALPDLAAQPAEMPSALLTALMRETFFLATSLQPAVVAALARQGGTQNPAVLDFAGTVSLLQAALPSFLEGEPTGNVTWSGLAPAPILVGAWAGTPWLPLLLQYEIGFQPVHRINPASGGGRYPSGLITQRFQWSEDSIELQYTDDALADEQVYEGTVVLTPRAQADLASAIQSYLEQSGNSDPELKEILAQVRSMNQLAQGLTGTVQAMLMREQALQMQVADPLANSFVQPFVQKLRQAVGDQGVMAPAPNDSFNPIRAGALSLKRLRLVDVFGRFKDYLDPTVVVAKGLSPPPALALSSGQAFLPPRLAQPSRLLFRWLSAADDTIETNSHPDSSPIVGWVLPNLLDHSLFLYAADGTALGELALNAGKTQVLWFPAPGGAFPLSAPLRQVMAPQDDTLRDFAMAIYNDGDASFLAPFLQVISQSVALSQPVSSQQDDGLAVLLARPLALARATLTLDLWGPPAADQSWRSFSNTVLAGAEADTADFDQVRFPVKLGDLTQLNDGLVGYWIQQRGQTDFHSFFAPAAASSQGGVAPPTEETLTLTPRDSVASAVTVTLLLDPRGEVHASTGILPTKAISIPPDQYATALEAMALTFLTTPVLSGSNAGAPALALPREASGEWSWITAASQGQWSSQSVTDVTDGTQASLAYSPQQLLEGWLQLRDVESDS